MRPERSLRAGRSHADPLERPQPEQVDPIGSSAPSRTWMCASSKPAVIRPSLASTTSVVGPRQSRRPSSPRPTQAIRPSRTATALAAPTGGGPTSEPYGTKVPLRLVGDEDPATDDQQVGRVAHRARLASRADLTAGHSEAITLK